MFLNLSNHSSKNWCVEQTDAALKYGDIVDIPFPCVPADATENDVREMSEILMDQVKEINPNVVMCQGEFTLSYMVISKCLEQGIPCVAACSDRVVEEYQTEDGCTEKRAVFKFVKFREYVK